MADFFLFTTRGTEPFVKFVLVVFDQCAALTTTFTKITRNFLLSTTLYSMIIETCFSPKFSVAEVAGNSNPCGHTWGNGHTVTTRLIASVNIVRFTPFVPRHAYVTFSHVLCHIIDNVIVLRLHVKKDINTFVGLGLSLEYDTIEI